MKKINLLNKSQMKNILGGVAAVGSCSASCPGGTSVSCSGTNCAAIDGTGCAAIDGDTLIINTCGGSATPVLG